MTYTTFKGSTQMTESRDNLIAELRKLMKLDGVKRSKMGLVFEIYDTLVELRNSGVKAGDIEALLNDPDGVFDFKLPTGSLTSYMHRIKVKKAASRVERRVAVAPATVVPVVSKPKKPGKPKAKASAAPELLDGGKPAPPPTATSDDVKKALSEKQDFSRYNVD
jgi:hypothetical protein